MEGSTDSRARRAPERGCRRHPAQGSTWRDPPGLPGKKFGPRGNIPASAPINSITPRPARVAGAKALLATPVISFTAERNSVLYKKRDQWDRRPWRARHGTGIQPMQNGIAG